MKKPLADKVNSGMASVVNFRTITMKNQEEPNQNLECREAADNKGTNPLRKQKQPFQQLMLSINNQAIRSSIFPRYRPIIGLQLGRIASIVMAAKNTLKSWRICLSRMQSLTTIKMPNIRMDKHSPVRRMSK